MIAFYIGFNAIIIIVITSTIEVMFPSFFMGRFAVCRQDMQIATEKR